MTKVDSRDWYCPACDRMCDPSEITNREYHQHCGCFVGGWVQAFSKRLDDINDLEVALGQKDEQWHMAVEEVRRLTAELADLRAQLDEAVGLLRRFSDAWVQFVNSDRGLMSEGPLGMVAGDVRQFLAAHPRRGAAHDAEGGESETRTK